MNLAVALSEKYTPRSLLVFFRPDRPSTGVRHETGGPKGVPIEIIRQAAVSYIIGQITRPVTWVALARWVTQKAGMSITDRGISVRVAHLLQDRVLGKNEARNAMCAAYYIVCRAHGIRQPWSHIAERLLAVQKINKPTHRLCMDTLTWMKRQIEKAGE